MEACTKLCAREWRSAGGAPGAGSGVRPVSAPMSHPKERKGEFCCVGVRSLGI